MEHQPDGLVDITKLPLNELWKLDPDSVLSEAIRRVSDPNEDGKPARVISAFNSAI